ncbi:MAG: GH32 C-terminal domain-containing protein [Lachnospiraceae bacterium]|nr:GH32 C-terminal domain-containing protein [Lachnospiraceae bacterium]
MTISKLLEKARGYELPYVEKDIDLDSVRPRFHLSPNIGWMNDPNGFGVYKGEYHLYYQYHPYKAAVGLMFWGHAKTRDFVQWERLPAAIAPDTEADVDGCFSGTTMELDDGRQLLLYTGFTHLEKPHTDENSRQSICLAIGDGLNYEKYEGNPILSEKDLPTDHNPMDFRDPKIWKEGEYFYILACTRAADKSGDLLLYRSKDLHQWDYVGSVDSCRNEYGAIWECPDLFTLGDQDVILVSPQEMQNKGLDFHEGFVCMLLLGKYDKDKHRFLREDVITLDHGMDYYAAQTLESTDGRRICVAWMQDWRFVDSLRKDVKLNGTMSLPRELSMENGKLIQRPVREIENYRRNHVSWDGTISDCEVFPKDFSGRYADLEVTVENAVDQDAYKSFCVKIAGDLASGIVFRYEPAENTVFFDREDENLPESVEKSRAFKVGNYEGKIRFRILIDFNNIESFVNDGEQTASFMIFNDLKKDRISFATEGTAKIHADLYEIVI